MVDYTYLKNIISVEKFSEYISQTLVTTGLTYDNTTYEITIHFASQLSVEDCATLDSLVEVYTNPPIDINYLHRYINTGVITTEELEWTMTCSWVEPGNESLVETITSCKLLPATPDDSLDAGFEYYIRVLDVTNNTVLGQSTFTNTEYGKGVISISGFSSDESALELQVKKSTKGSRVSVTNVMCNYT